mmetsp:Transcript_14084/g.44420  ORF Transcript_14084/g.44420 Transcript_14084/m.44420 type:complete len:277 (-) Transcript_14084:143-973(-)
MRVPAPCSEKSSLRTAWGTRPSMMAAPPTPSLTAATAVWSLGIMPPLTTVEAMRSSACAGVMAWRRVLSASRTPGTSVRRRRRLAPRARATAPAAVSALSEKVSPGRLPAAMGARTGVTPWSRRRRRRGALTATGSPTKPRSTGSFVELERISSFSATTMSSSFPLSPSACPPSAVIAAAMPLLITPDSTISATWMVASSVTLSPSTNDVDTFSRSSIWPICGPPPWTTTGRTPSFWSRTMSCAKLRAAASSLIACPPYFTTTVLPAWCANWLKLS